MRADPPLLTMFATVLRTPARGQKYSLVCADRGVPIETGVSLSWHRREPRVLRGADEAVAIEATVTEKSGCVEGET